MRPAVRPYAYAFVMVLVLAAASPARAIDVQIEAETIGQGYQLRGADDTLINRRRITQYLGLHLFNIGPKDLMGRPQPRNQFYLSLSMRFDADVGDYTKLKELSGYTPQHELMANKLDLLYAYFGGRNVGGFLDFELGRQILIDLFDYYAFDGLHLTFHTPFFVAAEAWGGINVSGAGIFDSPVYRVDGVALGQNQNGSLGARQEDAIQPTFGVAVRTDAFRDLSARVSYMQTLSFTGQRYPGEPGIAVIDEKVAFTARGRLLHGLLVPWFGFRYNIMVGRLDELQGGVRAQLGRHGLSAEYVYAAPTFDGDSIWNVFATQAFNDVRLTYDVTWNKLRGYATAFYRRFGDQTLTDSKVTTDMSKPDAGDAYGARVGARYDLGRGYLRLDGYYEGGYGGLVGGVDLAGRLRIWGDPVYGLIGEARLSYVHFKDDVRTVDQADSFGVQAGLRYSFIRGLTLHVLVEDNVNRFDHSQFRFLALLDINFWLGTKSVGASRPRPWSGW